MNFIELIKDQLTDDVLGKLGSAIGESKENTKTAVGAAVPGLLSILASLVSSKGGADRLIDALRQVQQQAPAALGGLGDILSGNQPNEVKEKGGDLLSTLLGSSALPVILNLLGKFASISAGSAKGLLSFLTPFVLSMITKQLGGGLNANSLSSFFTEQKGNISKAMPAGFSLADVPGLSFASPTHSSPAHAAPAESGMPGWLLPVLGLAVLGLLAWWFMSGTQAPAPDEPGKVAVNVPNPIPKAPDLPKVAKEVENKVAKAVESAIPDTAKLGTDLGAIYTRLSDLLAGVKDAATAEAAAPKMAGLVPEIDGLKTLWDKIPEAARGTVAKVTTDNLQKLKDLIAKVLALPGVSEKLKPALDSMVAKLAGFAAS